MRTLVVFSIALSFFLNAQGQDIWCTAKDSLVFKRKISEFKTMEADSYGDTLVTIGKSFLRTPYVAHTLEIDDEPLVVNLGGLDCTTYIENVLVFGRLLAGPDRSFNRYIELLEALRYRDGIRKGYPSRLHYFSEWLKENEKKGWLKNIGNDLGGQEVDKTLDFMSTHRDSYAQLESDLNYQAIQEVEKSLSTQLCVVSQSALATNEHLIKSGDIIALATDIKGLDVTHTGMAYRQSDGRIHLLHASTKGGVEISELPLVDYLKTIKHNIGILVARPTN